MMNLGGRFSSSSISATRFSCTTRHLAPASSSSRTACTCGRIRRPLGAPVSIGVTSMTVSPACASSATRGRSGSVRSETSRTSAARNASTPSPVRAFVSTTGTPRACAARRSSSVTGRRSVLLRTRTAGVPSSRALASRVLSEGDRVRSDVTTIATSTQSSTASERRTRAWPSSPVSSIPAVSMKTTGPIGASSQAFSTGSVVVPATSDTMEILCPVRAFARELFPALRLPKRPK